MIFLKKQTDRQYNSIVGTLGSYVFHNGTAEVHTLSNLKSPLGREAGKKMA